jgi:hypothetical protein
MAELSEWLQLMLAEIARKQDELEGARAETARREAEQLAPSTRATSAPSTVGKLSTRTD